jgi:hypothetical protein
MKYEKPELVAVASATTAIQGGRKGASTNPDSSAFTIGAYEADE